jgi:hypothetical protein
MLEMLLPEYNRQLMENYQNIFSQVASQLRWLHFDDASRLVTRVGYLDDGWIRLRLDGHWEFTGELLRELSWTFYNVAESNRLLDSLAGALATRAMDKLRVSVVDVLPESPFNLARVAGTALTGRDWSIDFARLQNIDVALSSRASESTLSAIKAKTDNLDVLLSSRASEATLTLVRNLISDIDIGLSGYDAAYPRHDAGQWHDSTTYTVTETTWTEKTRLSYRPRSTRSAGYFIRFAIWGRVSAAGQTMYVRVRSGYRGVLGTATFTETSPTLREIRVYYQKALWWDDPIIFEAHVAGAGQTGYITYVDANFIPVEGLIHGILTDLSDLRALRTDTDGLLLQGLNKVGGVALTGRDWSSDFARLQNLDVPLSSFAGTPDQTPPGRGVVLLGFDGTYLRRVRVTSDGRLLATLG